MFHITQPLDSIRYMVFFMATIFGDVQYTPKWDIYKPLVFFSDLNALKQHLTYEIQWYPHTKTEGGWSYHHG